MPNNKISLISAVGMIVGVFIGVIALLFQIWNSTTLSLEMRLSLTNSVILGVYIVSTIAKDYFKKVLYGE